MNKRNNAMYNSIDLIIPIYNESKVLPLLIEELNKTFSNDALSRYDIDKLTYIFIDDGSQDESIRMIHQFAERNMNIKIVKLSRNFGHQSAITAGLSVSDADMTAIMDADLQDPPSVILGMIEKLREGYDVIYARRKNRKESKVKVVSFWLFYRLLSFLSPLNIPLDSGDFSLMSRRVILELNKLPEVLRFPRGLRAWIGFSQAEFSYERNKRKAGKSKYGFKKLYDLATNGIASMSVRPLKISQVLAFTFFIFGILSIWVIVFGYLNSQNILHVLLILSIINLFGNSLIMFSVYILGAYLGRNYLETKRRPSFIIEEIINLPSQS